MPSAHVQELAAGAALHRRHGRAVVLAAWFRAAAWALILAAVLLWLASR